MTRPARKQSPSTLDLEKMAQRFHHENLGGYGCTIEELIDFARTVARACARVADHECQGGVGWVLYHRNSGITLAANAIRRAARPKKGA